MSRESPQRTGRAYVGSYGGGGEAGSDSPGGIHILVLYQDGSLTPRSHAGPGIEAGFVCLAPGGQRLYVVDERKNDGRGPVGRRATISAFAVDPDSGCLTQITSQPSLGAYPTYASIDSHGQFLVTASHGSFDHVERIVAVDGDFVVENVYDDSTVALYPIAADGRLEPLADLYVLDGHGPDPGTTPQAGGHAQASAHAHSALFDPSGKFVITCDKGADRIYVLRLDREERRLDPVQTWSAAPATGPRHPAFHPSHHFMFVTDELVSAVSTFTFDSSSGALAHLSSVAATSPGFDGYNEPADLQIHPDGQFVFVNNRGEDTVVAFALDTDTGRLTFAHSVSIATSPHPGLAARSITFDESGRFLFVADRPADKVLTYAVDSRTGTMTKVSDTPVPQPAFVLVTH